MISNSLPKIHLFGSDTGTKYDDLLDQLIAQVDSIFENRLGIKHSASGGETISNEIADSDGTNEIQVKYKPITEITTVEYRDANWDFTEYESLAVGDMEFDQDVIYTRDHVVTGKGKRNLRITYKAGYSDANLPEDLKLAATLMVVGLFNQRNHVGFKSQTVLGMVVNLDEKQYGMLTEILDRYQSIIVL